ncbi:hypothetical protein CLPU_11c00180 [Gottschalkia purinilytica]|uniref:Nicotianamine synthase protein n=1 Tax=Gottschalkia purinilytica TaxID=1503 RepID=A0A0L0W955_GOTPU|nr:nicotianamine synthase family protein [Gottschalkia purinilytica]KNF07850.1 hypothetical protein CLPU_11c00180 [Gottschalkia purinilytica]
MKIIPVFTKGLETISSLFPSLIRLYRFYYGKIVKNEVELGNITEDDCILCIGGGPFPSTALEIAYQTGAKVCVVDCDPTAVKRAKKVISKLKMDEMIKVLHANGREIDVSDFSVIHLALQVFPKDEILSNVLNRCKCGARILVRRPKEKLKSFYSCLPEHCYCNSCKHICQEKSTMEATLLFIKTKGGSMSEEIPSVHGRIDFNRSNSLVG